MKRKAATRYRGNAVFPRLAIGAVILAVPAVTLAQQITGTPGSPSATTTIQGDQLPPAPGKFGGTNNRLA